MESVSQLRELFRYDDWANRLSVSSVAVVDSPPLRACEIAAHLAGAQWLWMTRLGLPDTAKMPVWPKLNLDQCETELHRISAGWLAFIDELTSDTLLKQIAYINSKGEPWKSTTHEILTHILIHSGYHRGQIATLLGQAGHQPAYTDYIHCTRQSLLDSEH